MRPRVYLIMFFLILPFQAALFDPLSVWGVRPDLALAVVYAIGLITGPTEALLAGTAVGLLQDLGSAGLIGFTGLTRGLAGLFSGLLGRRMLNMASPSNVIFLGGFSLLESILISVFLQILYGSVPFFSLLLHRMLPQALYTGLLGALMLRFISRKPVMAMLTRRTLLEEL